jgi:type IV pilus assembly protein PilY1
VTMDNRLFDATTNAYAGEYNGFYHSFATGEKGVNAPLAVNGFVFFATNRPTDPSSSCSANLGEAKAYAISPFDGATTSNILAGGGLAPSPVSGLITITNPDGTTSEEKFCIGCAMDCTGSTCSALENSPPPVAIPKNMRRTYWYRK